MDLWNPTFQRQSQGWVRARGPADSTQGSGGTREVTQCVRVVSSALLISLSKVKDTDCCELTLTLPFTFCQGELEKPKVPWGEFQGLKEGASLCFLAEKCLEQTLRGAV